MAGRQATDELDSAIETFARGFAQVRSRTHPYLAERFAGIWLVRDGPRKNAADYRREEYIAQAANASPAEVDSFARTHTRGRYAICYIVPAGTDDGPVRSAFKTLKYRLGGTEGIFAHDLRRLPKADAGIEVQRIDTPELAAVLAESRGQAFRPEADYSMSAPMRSYAILQAGRAVAWVQSGRVGNATYCSSMYTHPDHRRRGYARNLLLRMLRDDRAVGATGAHLTASHAGGKLYPTVGYRHIATLMLYTPVRK
ncbi:MAG: GNAT family N-acetyltransferase [Tepidisphaeraceae bacterium]